MPDVPVWLEGKRLMSVDGGSSDLVALKDGGYRQFELKTRCDHGTKSAAATGEIAADLHRGANHEGFTFIGVFDFAGVPMHGLAVRQDVPGNGVRVIVVVDRAAG